MPTHSHDFEDQIGSESVKVTRDRRREARRRAHTASSDEFHNFEHLAQRLVPKTELDEKGEQG